MSGFSLFSFSVLIGGALAGGVLCMITALPRWAAAPLVQRIAPYVRDVVADANLPPSALPVVHMLPAGKGSPWGRLRTTFERALGGRDVLQRRLAQAGIDMSASAFRGRQLGWMVLGIAAGAVAVIILVLTGRMTAPVSLLPLLAGAGCAVAYDMQLGVRVGVRRARLTDELPTTLEFLALCLSAGEGFLDSLRRVALVGSGALTIELRAVVVAVGTGSSVADALTELATRLQLPGLTRAVDQVIAALEHGAPLAAVLHAQAGDAREDAKRVLIEQAGRKEILMLLPLVFLILPLSVLFAIYPGLFILRLGIG